MNPATTIENHPAKYTIIAFYKFINVNAAHRFQRPLKEFLLGNDIKGTVLITPEGINGTISGLPLAIEKFKRFIQQRPEFKDLTYKTSYFHSHAFERAKVKLKQETISLGQQVDMGLRGNYVKPEEWNNLISQNDVINIDTRNDYEVDFGTFKNAINPKTLSFKDLTRFTEDKLKQHKNKKIAIFCTGGIRCEKYSAYLLQEGFKEVYHLEGGILNYIEKTPKEESLWQGDCYVFDERTSVNHNLKSQENAGKCPESGKHIFTKDRHRIKQQQREQQREQQAGTKD